MTNASDLSHAHARLILAALIGALALQALGGLLIPGVYRDSLWVVTALRSSDITTLAVVIPLLIGLHILVRRGSLRAQLASAGVAFFIWESNLYYLAGCAFNQLFLAYVAVAILSLAMLVMTIIKIDRADLAARAARRMPRKPISMITAAMAAILAVLWIGQSVSYIATGKLPQMLVDAGGSVHLVAALDLSMLAPVYLLGAVLLWRGRVWGHIISAAVLVQGALVTIGLILASPVQAAAGLEGAWTMTPLWGLMGVCFLISIVLLLGNITQRQGAGNEPTGTDVSAEVKRAPAGPAVMLGLIVIFVALAVVTVLPLPASKPNALGYVSLCAFAPWSTLTLLALAGASGMVRARLFPLGRTDLRAARPERQPITTR